MERSGHGGLSVSSGVHNLTMTRFMHVECALESRVNSRFDHTQHATQPLRHRCLHRQDDQSANYVEYI